MQYFNPMKLPQINQTLGPIGNLKPTLTVVGEPIKVEPQVVNDNSNMLAQKLAELKPIVQAKLKEIYGNPDDLVVIEYKVMKELEEYATSWLNGREFDSGDNISGMLSTVLNDKLNEILERLRNEQNANVTNDGNETEEPSVPENNVPVKFLEELTGEDLGIILDDLDYSQIEGYYANQGEKVSDSTKGKESVIEFIENNLKAQLVEQLTEQLKALGLEFSDLENVFNNVFTQTAWDTVNSFDQGAKVKYNVADLINKFLNDFNKNLDETINKINESNTDLDLENLDLQNILNNYDVESGNVTNTKVRDGALEQINSIVAQLTEQLATKALEMCNANGIKYDVNMFIQILNNAKAYATENCDMNYNDKKYNGNKFIEEFLNNFKTSYTEWVKNTAKALEVSKKNSFSEVTGDDLEIDKTLLDYSSIEGYFRNENESLSDSVKNREKIVNMLDAKLKVQLKSQITAQLQAMGLKFADIENIFNNVFNRTAWDTVNSFDKGLRIRYNVADLVNKFIEDFNKNLDKVIADVNASDKDLDLADMDYTQILKNYDVESGSEVNAGKKNAAVEQAQEIASLLKAQLQAKARTMCAANGITYSENSFNTQFNNAVAYAIENCDMNNRAKKYNPQDFITAFLTKFEQNYTSWVERQ